MLDGQQAGLLKAAAGCRTPRRWTRRLLWTCVCFLSLITALWQWENWRSARELAAAHRRVVERLGTDDPMAFMPPKVADEQNYFANPVLESWLRVTNPETGRMKYTPPAKALLPKAFIIPETFEQEDGETERLDLNSWFKKRGIQTNEAPAVVLARELGDGNGLLPKLAEGLNKPFSIIKPGQQEAMEATRGNPWQTALPEFQNMTEFQRQLGLHLRSAALVGDSDKVANTALIMLRFSEAPARGGMIGCLMPLGLHIITFDALHEALSHPAWTEESLGRLQLRLGQFDDLENHEKAHACEILMMFRALAHIRSHPDALGDVTGNIPNTSSGAARMVESVFRLGMRHGPVGWHDANLAFYADCMLEQLGPPGRDAWLGASSRDEKVKQWSNEANKWPNPRRVFGVIALPNLGNITQVSAETLFHRRCLIIACALEKHRLRHGAFPASLDTVKDDLKLFSLDDPARPGSPLGYRLEKDGYLLWSAGPDALDDGGVKDKDWLWRMRRG